MKLRKLLAGITAAALAVSAMAFSSLSVSAAEEANVESKTVAITTKDSFEENSGNIVIQKYQFGAWGTFLNCDDYEKVEIECSDVDLGNGSSAVLFLLGPGEGNVQWVQESITAESKKATIEFKNYAGKKFYQIGVQISGTKAEAFTGNIEGTVKLYKKAAKGPVADGETSKYPITIWEGTQALGWSNFELKEDLFAGMNSESDNYLVAKFTADGDDSCIKICDGAWKKFFAVSDGETEIAKITGTTFYQKKLTYDDVALIKASGLTLQGQQVTLKSITIYDKEYTENTTSTDTPAGGGQTGGTTTPSTPAPTISSNKHQGVGMPPVVIDHKSAPAASAGETAAASGSTSVTLGDSTVVSKDVIDSVSGKDAEFKLANGASWEIAAADAAKAEGMDLGITLNTTAATADQIKEVANDNDTFQFSLAYSGDFGFSAVVNIPVDAKYNGKYANLYWLNGGKLEFIGSSKVEGGIADFTMKHASDYVIVFDDEAYGEDVSSGAGIYEESETSAAPVAVVVTFAALAVSAVILKKRVF